MEMDQDNFSLCEQELLIGCRATHEICSNNLFSLQALIFTLQKGFVLLFAVIFSY